MTPTATPERASPWRWLRFLPVLAVAAALCAAVVAGRGSGSGSEGTADAPASPSAEAVEVSSDAPRAGSLEELLAASDLVVRGTVTATERGRWFGDGAGGTRIQSRLVTLEVAEVLSRPGSVAGDDSGERTDGLVAGASAGTDLLVEEEGWLEDGAPLVIDGAAPSAVGDAGIWFLVSTGDPETEAWIVVSAQGRYLLRAGEGERERDGDRLRGAEGDDPLIARLEALGADELADRLRAA